MTSLEQVSSLVKSVQEAEPGPDVSFMMDGAGAGAGSMCPVLHAFTTYSLT